jgi:fimbrial chaperone protein
MSSRRIFGAVTIFMFLSTMSWGLSLEPLIQSFNPASASGRIRTFRVTNTTDQPIAVVIRMTTRSVDENGAETREEADNDFVVFPSRVTLQPGTSQAVRVQYTGTGGQEVERAYRIIAEQIPVDFGTGTQESGGAIDMLFRYIGAVYVTPPGSRQDVVLAEAERRPLADGRAGFLLRFENRGTRHAILGNLTVTLTLSDTGGSRLDSLSFATQDLTVLGGKNVLAGNALEQTVELPESWGTGIIDVTYDVDLLQ